jgi:heme-degrading monooxygenase HmoA
MKPPYYAVVFTSQRTAADGPSYEEMAERMASLAEQQPGYLGIDSARGADGVGITVSYWESLEAIKAWREHAEHQVAQSLGRSGWYAWYRLRICRVDSEYGFPAPLE